MRVGVNIRLGNLGCLSVVVLAAAIHWTVVARFGVEGMLGGFFVWTVAIVAALVVVGAVSARNDRLSRAALARAACPWCNAVLGEPTAARIVADARSAGASSVRAGGAQGPRAARMRQAALYAGECPACHGRIRFDWDDRRVTREE